MSLTLDLKISNLNLRIWLKINEKMDFSNKEIYNYIDNHSSDESDILYELRRETELKCLNPIMLSGKIQGNFLAIISKLIKTLFIFHIL